MAVALLLAPKVKVSEKLDVFCQSMGNSGVMMIVLIYLMAGGFQGAAATMGGKDSVINMALHLSLIHISLTPACGAVSASLRCCRMRPTSATWFRDCLLYTSLFSAWGLPCHA